MEVINLTIAVGTFFAMLVLAVFPQMKWFERLNSFTADTTIEEILEEHRKEDHDS